MAYQLYVASTRGMCAGVARAIEVVQKALDKYGANNLFVLHEVVHNKHVVGRLREAGAKFVESIEKIPPNCVVIFSAHGVGLEVIREAKARNLKIIDATCPLVKRIHFKMNKAAREGKEAVVIGHRGHQEVTGIIGQYAGDEGLVHVILTPEDVETLQPVRDELIFATQTTLSVDETARTVQALKRKFPNIEGPRTDDTCFATQHRQSAIKDLCKICDVIIVAGSANSSNSNRLKEVAQQCGVQAYLIDDASEIKPEYLQGHRKIGLSAGASVPEEVVNSIIEYFKGLGLESIEEVGQKPRHAVFPLPPI